MNDSEKKEETEETEIDKNAALDDSKATVNKVKTANSKVSHGPIKEKAASHTPERTFNAKIMNAMKTHQVLRGRIDGVENKNSEAENIDALSATIHSNGVKILIPIKKLWFKMPASPKTAEPHDVFAHLRSLMDAMLGSIVEFYITDISSDGNTAYADRTAAMKTKRQQYYVEKDHDGLSIIERAIQNKQKVQAHVMSIAGTSIRVEIFGVETIIQAKDACWRYTPHLTTAFRPGQDVWVIVKSGVLLPDGDIQLEASVKEATVNQFKQEIQGYKEDGIYSGVITGTSKKGGYFVAIGTAAHGFDVYCNKVFYQAKMPSVGDIVGVRIRHFYLDSGNALGSILRIICPAAPEVE